MDPEKIIGYSDAVEDVASTGADVLHKLGRNIIGLARGLGVGWMLFLTFVLGRQAWLNQDRVVSYVFDMAQANPVEGLPWDRLDPAAFPLRKRGEVVQILEDTLFKTNADKAVFIAYIKGHRVIVAEVAQKEGATIPPAFWETASTAPGYSAETAYHLRRRCYETTPGELPRDTYFRYALDKSRAGFYYSCPYDGMGFVAVSYDRDRDIDKAPETGKAIVSEASFALAEVLGWKPIPDQPYEPEWPEEDPGQEKGEVD